MCGTAYDTHDWQWRGARLVCGDCGAVDLPAARMLRAFTAAVLGSGGPRHDG